MTPLEDAWRRLEGAEGTTHGAVVLRIEPHAACGLQAAVEFPGPLRALYATFEGSALGGAASVPQSSGLSVRTDLLEGGKTRLAFVLRNRRYRDLFTVLANDLVSSVAPMRTEVDAAGVLIERVASWQQFFRRGSGEALTDERQLGLLGELEFLRTQLLPHGDPLSSLEAWRGPYQGNQDFQFPGGPLIEVKSTRSGSHQRMRINGARQLDGGGAPLLLVHLAFEESAAEGWTLPQMVDAVRSLLEHHPSASALLEDGLEAAGYRDEDAHRYTSFHVLRSSTNFRVDDGFPCIRESDLKPGIGDLSYTIMVAGCGPWIIGEGEMKSLLSKR